MIFQACYDAGYFVGRFLAAFVLACYYWAKFRIVGHF